MKPLLVALLLVASCWAQDKSGASLSEQKMCYEQGQALRGKHTQTLQHYSKRENVCYVRLYQMLYDSNDKFQGVAVELEDGFEGVSYGLCLSDADGKVTTCWMSDPSGGENKKFADLDGWMHFVMSTYLSKQF